MISRLIVFGAVLSVAGSGAAFADEQRDYGAYISGECITCHRLDGGGENIPPILGWDPEDFVQIMKLYQSGERDNPAMVNVARSLDLEQLQALAAYFGSLEPKG